MNILTFFKGKKQSTKIKNDSKKYKSAPNKSSIDDAQTELSFDILEEKFLRLNALLDTNKLVLQDKYEQDKIASEHIEDIITDGLNKARRRLLEKLTNDRDFVLKHANLKTQMACFRENPSQFSAVDYIFPTYYNLDHRQDLSTKFKYLKLMNTTSHEVNLKNRTALLNSWYGDIDMLVISHDRLFFYFKTTSLMQLTNFQCQVQAKKYLNFERDEEEIMNFFDFINFKTNSHRIVCVKHVYNRTLLVVFDLELNEIRRLLMRYRGDICLVSATEILIKEYNFNTYHLYDYDLESVAFQPKMDRNEAIIKLTSDKMYTFCSSNGMNFLKIASRANPNSERVQLSFFLDKPIDQNRIRVDLKQQLVVILDKNKFKLFDLNSGLLVAESSEENILKACDSIELVEGQNSANCSIFSLNRYKNKFIFV